LKTHVWKKNQTKLEISESHQQVGCWWLKLIPKNFEYSHII